MLQSRDVGPPHNALNLMGPGHRASDGAMNSSLAHLCFPCHRAAQRIHQRVQHDVHIRPVAVLLEWVKAEAVAPAAQPAPAGVGQSD